MGFFPSTFNVLASQPPLNRPASKKLFHRVRDKK